MVDLLEHLPQNDRAPGASPPPDATDCLPLHPRVAEIAAIVWEACGEDPAELQLEHPPSFDVDVQRRWPCVTKARDRLNWEAKIGPREGIASTAAWLRETL